MSVRPFPLSLIAYFPFAAAILILTIVLIGLPLLARKKSFQCANQWMPRHLIGLLLIFLPIGVAICIMPLCQSGDCANVILNYRLAFSYVTILAIFAHCNFSQLAAWPKTTAAVFIGLLHIAGVFYCEFNLKHLVEEVVKSV